MRPFAIVALAALYGCATPTSTGTNPTAKPAAKQTLFFDVTLIDLDSGKVTKDQSVLVEDDKIVKVGRFDSFEQPPNAVVVEGKGRVMLPAFTDMHVHLTRATDLPLYVAHGVTQVRNMWGAPMHLQWKKQIAARELLGPAIVTAGPIVDGELPIHDGSFIVTSKADAEAVVALHKEQGYDFVKVYSGLDPFAYAQVQSAARAAGLSLVGHVPRQVGLTPQLASELRSIEHLTGMADALKKAGGVAPLVDILKKAEVWSCPTRVVMTPWTLDADGFARAVRAPEMAYVPQADLVTWNPERADLVEKNRAAVAGSDALILELHRATDKLLVGTDVGNPLIVPGASLHDELANLVRIGLTPREALRVAIKNSAVFLNQLGERGAIAPGMKAELVLIDGDPLSDIRVTRDLAGVYTQGRYLDQKALESLKQKAATLYVHPDPLGGRDSMKPKGAAEAAGGTAAKWSATFSVSWKGAPFGGERIYTATTPTGEQQISAESYDLHAGQWRTMNLFAGESFRGKHLVLGSDGAQGQGRATLRREEGQLVSDGTTASGAKESNKAAIADSVHLVADRFLASMLLYRNKLQLLPIGETVDVEQIAAGIGSRVSRQAAKVQFKRLPDAQRTTGDDRVVTVRRYEVRTVGQKSELQTDTDGYPVLFLATMFNAPLKFQRIDAH